MFGAKFGWTFWPFLRRNPTFSFPGPQIVRNCSRERSLEHCHSHAFLVPTSGGEREEEARGEKWGCFYLKLEMGGGFPRTEAGWCTPGLGLRPHPPLTGVSRGRKSVRNSLKTISGVSKQSFLRLRRLFWDYFGHRRLLGVPGPKGPGDSCKGRAGSQGWEGVEGEGGGAKYSFGGRNVH